MVSKKRGKCHFKPIREDDLRHVRTELKILIEHFLDESMLYKDL